MLSKIRGMTLVGMLLTMTVIIIAGVVLMRVVPAYIQHYEVTTSLAALNNIPASEFTDDPATNADVLKTRLLNQLYVNSLEGITPQQIKITPDGKGNFNISIQYQVIKPLIANIRLLFDFEAKQEVKIGPK